MSIRRVGQLHVLIRLVDRLISLVIDVLTVLDGAWLIAMTPGHLCKPKVICFTHTDTINLGMMLEYDGLSQERVRSSFAEACKPPTASPEGFAASPRLHPVSLASELQHDFFTWLCLDIPNYTLVEVGRNEQNS